VNKQRLIDEVAKDAGLERQHARRIVENVLDQVGATLQRGEEVRLVGFGTFSVSTRKPSKGRNPRTGEPIEIDPVRNAKFSAGKRLKEIVN
jgi:DNA-binding protein HU-beta